LSLFATLGITQVTPEQEIQIDSLKRVINSAENDTTIIEAWNNWDNIIYRSDPDLDYLLNQKIDSLCAENLKNELSETEKTFFLEAKSSALNVLGIVHQSRGDLANTIDYFTQSLKIREELEDQRGVAVMLNNIGIIYKNISEYEQAFEYFIQSLTIRKEIKDDKGMGSSLNNIGLVNFNIGELEKAADYYQQSLIKYEQVDYKYGIASVLNNMGLVYDELEKYNVAIEHYKRSLIISKEIEDDRNIALTLNNIGKIYEKKGDLNNALKYSKQALSLAQKLGVANETRNASKALWKLYKLKGNHKLALEMHELYIETRDTIKSAENEKEIIRQQFKYDYEKQAATDSIKNAEAQKVQEALLIAEKAESKQHQLEADQHKMETKQEKQFSYFLYVIIGLALLFGGFIFNRFRITSKQKSIIQEQKHKVDEAYDELEEKSQEILDSITYAKRIQSAILPPRKVVKEYLQESFILYKPKDIVAGDFYWLEHKEKRVLFAAADCTGHGVPGAMVSVICNNGLNRSVREYGLTDPGLIQKSSFSGSKNVTAKQIKMFFPLMLLGGIAGMIMMWVMDMPTLPF